MASNEQYILEIQRIFAEKLFIGAPSVDTDLLDTGVIDSVTIVQLVLELETSFGVTLPFEDLVIDDFRSIQCMAKLISTRIAPAIQQPA